MTERLKVNSADWPAMKAEFIATRITYEDLAAKHGVKAGTVRSRAARENWMGERDKIVSDATKIASEQRKNELLEFNDQSLKVAKALQNQIAQHIVKAQARQSPIIPRDLRALASAAEAAQRMGRLALGVSTDNHQHTGANGQPIVASVGLSRVTKAMYADALKEALASY